MRIANCGSLIGRTSDAGFRLHRSAVYAALALMLLTGCTKTEKASSPSPVVVGEAVKSAPACNIISASLTPDNPVSKTPLTVHYDVRDPNTELTGITFRWFVDNELVQEGPNGTLVPGSYRKGSVVYAEVVPCGAGGEGSPNQTKPVTIGNLPPSITAIVLQPVDPTVGAILRANPSGEDPDGDTVSFQYQWFVNGKAATEPQATGEFNTARLKKKEMIYVVVTPSDGTNSGEPAASDVVVLINSAPQITSTPKYAVQNGVYQYQVTAKDSDGDPLTYSLLKSPQGMTIDGSTGFIRWELPKEIAERQEVAIKISVDDGDGGTAYQEFSLSLQNSMLKD